MASRKPAMFVFEKRRCSEPGSKGFRLSSQLSGSPASERPHTVLNWP